MHFSLFGLALTSIMATAAMAAPDSGTFNEAAFEKRFKAADIDNTGRLSKQQAYAAFPRMPEFFVEIDENQDGYITMVEVTNAMERRVSAAINESQIGSGYSGAAEMKDGGEPVASGKTVPRQQFSSAAEARRYHRYQYYESLSDSQENPMNRGEIAPTTPTQLVPAAPMQLDKSF
jgi:hypothetical protein